MAEPPTSTSSTLSTSSSTPVSSDMPPWRQALGTQRLLVSGFGKWGGGVYDLTSGTPAALDDLPTSGLTTGGDRVWRVLRAPGEQSAACELLSYDARGVRSYQRFDEIRDPHDVCWHDGAVHITSSWDSVVWRIDGGGDVTPGVVWRGGSVPDSWHINSLLVVDGRLHVCAFGRHDRYKAWKKDGNRHTGFVHDTVRGVDVLTGLGHPHTPRFARGRWYLCESAKGALIEYGPRGREVRRVVIKRFSRGLAIVGDWALVGGNAHRKEEHDRAAISVVDLRSFEVVENIPMPCLEIYDIVVTPLTLARGLALGFGNNPARAVEQHRGIERPADQRPTPSEARVQLVPPRVAAKLVAAGTVLDRAVTTRLRVEAALPPQVVAGEVIVLEAMVENRSRLAVATVSPNPVRLGARWIPLDAESGNGHEETAGENGDGEPAGDATPRTVINPTTPLPRLLNPGERAAAELVLVTPDEPGRYQLRVALRQPTVGWFGRRTQAEVTVLPRPTTETAGEPAETETQVVA